MTQRNDLDQMLLAWLDDPYTPSAPRYLPDVLERTRRTRQRPAWANLERWLPMADKISQPPAAAPLRMARFLLIALIVVALAATIVAVGSQLLRSPAPVPQGGAAVLVLDAFAGQQRGDIFLVRADGSDLRQLTSGPDIDSGPVWSPDGTRVAYRALRDGSDQLVVMDAGGANQRTLATISEQHLDCVGGSLAWSPDGKAIIFPTSAACDDPYEHALLTQEEVRHDLFIVAADGSSPATRLLAPGLFGSSAVWAPDGRRIAFVGRQETGATGLYVVDMGSGGVPTGGLQARLITDAATGLIWTAPRWSPDGSELAAAAGTNGDCRASNTGTMDAFIVKADGSGQRALAADAAKEYNPTWSPDGTRLAFQRIVDSSERVNGRPCTMATWVTDAGGTNQRRLEGLLSDEGLPPFWSPDGTRLTGDGVEVIDFAERYPLYIVSVDGSSPLVKVGDAVNSATWQPVAAPLPLAPSFLTGSAAP